jgi:hypothetical protein
MYLYFKFGADFGKRFGFVRQSSSKCRANHTSAISCTYSAILQKNRAGSGSRAGSVQIITDPYMEHWLWHEAGLFDYSTGQSSTRVPSYPYELQYATEFFKFFEFGIKYLQTVCICWKMLGNLWIFGRSAPALQSYTFWINFLCFRHSRAKKKSSESKITRYESTLGSLLIEKSMN